MPTAKEATHYFYTANVIATIKKAGHYATVFRTSDQLAAVVFSQEHSTLLATDSNSSVLRYECLEDSGPRSYTAYGASEDKPLDTSGLAFNGERLDRLSSTYLLGNGYRCFSPSLMRFLSPDNLSPFEHGGINAYAYCSDDPINFTDPTGHMMRRRAPHPVPREAMHNRVIELVKKNANLNDNFRSANKARNAATAELNGLNTRYANIDKSYGINQRGESGLKTKPHPDTVAKAANVKEEIVRRRVELKHIIADSQATMDSVKAQQGAMQEEINIYKEKMGDDAFFRAFNQTRIHQHNIRSGLD
ncbi:RHS repeat-associated core domain protein-containing protein [Pseudomonas sp. GM84]|uniref:RHS repeat-associated core domain-containing protein n=1 Tax=Pseudomonas sp. GM84 TaxID=1144340 RepID=UPI00026F7977|nr:RHS repeat-associated core domain-containing protein [Pseudomonas sp. GM84]EJN37230.1 RHS repeat-associated core domain protein-containing protein [Pseudomonas sp. GM84]